MITFKIQGDKTRNGRQVRGSVTVKLQTSKNPLESANYDGYK